MAQHIPIENFKQKAFRKIEQSIRQQQYFNTSMKFDDLPYEDLKEQPTDEVYWTERTIPKGIIWGSNRGGFEVHTEPAKFGRKATNIYLVA